MPIINKNEPIEIRRFAISLTVPFVFIVLFWLVKLIELYFDIQLHEYGIYPRNLASLKGILFTPFLHGDLNHLMGNSVSFFILSVTLFYFYPHIAFRVFFWLYLISHVLLWIGGRESWHIGASVLIYGFASFLFVSGIIRKYIPLMAISLMVIFLYGGMIWHIMPVVIDDPVSWEGHLYGAITGVILSFVYRKEGPKRPPWSWELEEENENEDNSQHENQDNNTPPPLNLNQNSTGHSGFSNYKA